MPRELFTVPPAFVESNVARKYEHLHPARAISWYEDRKHLDTHHEASAHHFLLYNQQLLQTGEHTEESLCTPILNFKIRR